MHHPYYIVETDIIIILYANIRTMTSHRQSLIQIVSTELCTYNSFVHALSGCIGGATAITIFYPLNTVRLKLQVDPTYKEHATFTVLANIYKNEGVRSLYQGLPAQVIALACSNFVYFYTYEMFKSIYRVVYSTRNINSIPNLFIAAVAGVINVCIHIPYIYICVCVRMYFLSYTY
jgi:hypothetical protein